MLAGLLNIVRGALLIGATLTGVAALVHANAGHTGDAALYTLLCAVCVLGLLIRPANKRPTA